MTDRQLTNQVSDEFSFTQVIDCDKYDAIRGADKHGSKSGDIDGALDKFEKFIKGFLDPPYVRRCGVSMAGVGLR